MNIFKAVSCNFFKCVFAFTIFSGALHSLAAEENPFPTPDVLKENVAFWIKIYTEVSLSEGLIHDRDYPQIIFEKISAGSGGGQGSYSTRRKALFIESLHALETQPESLWTERERAVLSLYTNAGIPGAIVGASERIRFQLGQKERFKQGLERSSMYIDTIRSILRENGLPLQIAYLPHVESSFNTEAYSKVGAAGLWQFMRGTGRIFLKINYLVDERRDPIIASKAAARFLKANYNQLQAWPLAITAYNHGANGMKRAIEATGSRDIAVILQKYQSPSFQFASKNFYACFLAASTIAANPTLYFTNIAFKPKFTAKSVSVPYQVKPSVLCKHLGISQDVLQKYNPSFRPVVFSRQQLIPAGYPINIPVSNTASASEIVSAVQADSQVIAQAKVPTDLNNYYTVKNGDNLASIAKQVGVTSEALALENNITRSNRIYEGQALRIPSHAPITVASVEASVAAPVSTPVVLSPTPVQVAHKQSKADSIAKAVAAAKQVPVVVAQAKPMFPATQVLPDSLKEIVQAPAAQEPVYSSETVPSVLKFDADIYQIDAVVDATGKSATIIVSMDETVGHYAEWLGTTVARIKQVNGLSRNFSIKEGRKLKIPVDSSAVLERFTKARIEYHLAIEEDFYSQYDVSEVKSHLIKRGESLWDICNGTDQVPLWLFKKLNRSIDITSLQPGTSVWLPVIEDQLVIPVAAGASTMPHPAYWQPIRPALFGPQMLR